MAGLARHLKLQYHGSCRASERSYYLRPLATHLVPGFEDPFSSPIDQFGGVIRQEKGVLDRPRSQLTSSSQPNSTLLRT